MLIRYRGTPAASLAAARVARSSSCTTGGSPAQASMAGRSGSFIVTARAILIPNAAITRSQYLANSAGASGFSQPARIANQCGEVKWLNVTTGARPRARQWPAIAA